MKQPITSQLAVDYKRITDLCDFCNNVLSASMRNIEFEGLGHAPSPEEMVELIGATCNRDANRKIIIKITKTDSKKISSLSKVFVSQLGTVEMIKILDSYSNGSQTTKDIAELLRKQLKL